MNMKDENWKIIDAAGSIEEVEKSVTDIVSATIARVHESGGEVGKLWVHDEN